MQKTLHPNNKHRNGYDFDVLVKSLPSLDQFLIERYGKQTIDFSNDNAVKTLNKALLKAYYKISYWEFPDENLCPPIPGRVDYIHHLADLVKDSGSCNVLDIGTGANCIYPLLGVSEYNWKFVATDIDKTAIKYAEKNIKGNNLTDKITVRLQENKEQVLKGIVTENDTFDLIMCNPPFYKSEIEAKEANSRKTKNLKITTKRNFSGRSNELWCRGGEKAFLHTYLYESSNLKSVSQWYTSLVSKKETVKSLELSAKKLGTRETKVIQMQQGNKITRVFCWRF